MDSLTIVAVWSDLEELAFRQIKASEKKKAEGHKLWRATQCEENKDFTSKIHPQGWRWRRDTWHI